MEGGRRSVTLDTVDSTAAAVVGIVVVNVVIVITGWRACFCHCIRTTPKTCNNCIFVDVIITCVSLIGTRSCH
jgi:predicted benzoate:H+ symporter BenE